MKDNKLIERQEYNVEILIFEKEGDVVINVTDTVDDIQNLTLSGKAATDLLELVESYLLNKKESE